MTHLFYRDADACMIVFDVSKYETLNYAAKWKDDFDLKVNYAEDRPKKPCILIGNKVILFKRKQNFLFNRDVDFSVICQKKINFKMEHIQLNFVDIINLLIISKHQLKKALMLLNVFIILLAKYDITLNFE